MSVSEGNSIWSGMRKLRGKAVRRGVDKGRAVSISEKFKGETLRRFRACASAFGERKRFAR
jgi:hypothetical protein